VLYPSDWEPDLAPLLGAPMVYQQLHRWLERDLGMRFGPPAPATTPPPPPEAPADAPTVQ
jgi:hypothetical protein